MYVKCNGDKERVHHRDEWHKVLSGFVLFQDDNNKEQMGKTEVRRRVKCSMYAPNLTGQGRVDKWFVLMEELEKRLCTVYLSLQSNMTRWH